MKYKYKGHCLSKAKIKWEFQVRPVIDAQIINEIRRMHEMGVDKKYIAAHLGVSKFSVWLYTSVEDPKAYIKMRNERANVTAAQRRRYSRQSYARKVELYKQDGLIFGD